MANGDAAEQPLLGRTVVVTRAKAQSSELAAKLRDLGARVLECPLIRVERVADLDPLDSALDRLDEFDWILFTSSNAIEFFFDRLVERGLGDLPQRPPGVRPRFAAVGSGTARSLADRGAAADLVPPVAVAESLAETLIRQGVKDKRLLFPRARMARETMCTMLAAAGASVEDVVVYDTLQDADGAGPLRQALASGVVDVVTFGSASTVESFHTAAGDVARNMYQVVSIGPITTGKARELGYTVAATAREHTVDGLVQAVVEVAGAATVSPGRQ
ncbi:MAG: uroporphyrinogen-III synthase [Candidatus Wallbacteria bacterium]|nr:uroporphyrinogen-III synthase [Candidatus Wallbacteria bacterium]